MTLPSPITILHVDDEPGFGEMVKQFLQREDDSFTVHTATNVAEGLTILAETSVNCIVSDHDMPERTGIEFLESVREDHPDLPFILFTGKGSEEIASRAISAGVTDYLQKETSTSQYTILANRIRNVVGRQQAREGQKINERRFEAVFEDPKMLVSILSPKGKVRRVNQTAMQFVQRGHEEIAETPFWKTPWWDAEIRSDVREWVNRAAEGEYVTFEADLTKPSGNLYSVSGTIRPVSNEAGDITSLIASAKEITGERKQQRELEEEQAFIEQALNTLSDPFYVVGTDGYLRRWNNSLNEATGYTDTEISEMHVSEFFSDERCERILQAIDDVLETGQAAVHAEFVTVKEAEIPYEFTGARLTDTQDNLIGLVGIGRDLSERRKRERELERVRDLLDHTERIADVGGWEINPETEKVFCTKHLFEILDVGYDEELPLGEALDLYHEDDRLVVARAIETALDSGEPFAIEVRFVTPADDLRWLRVQGIPRTEDDEVVTLRGAVQDITDRKEHEQELERQNAQLERFASIVAHDIRNPLAVAKGRLELIDSETECEHLDAIERAVYRIERIVDDMLWLTREGQDIGSTEMVDLGEAVESSWKIVADNNDEVELALGTDELSDIVADNDRLCQLLENLFSNAIEHGGGTVTVGRLPDGFYIEDDGPGIPSRERKRMFDVGISTGKNGLGFGLNIVKQIVQGHEWNIHISDRDGGGARFEITGVDVTNCDDS